MGIQEKNTKMKGSKIVFFFGGILLIGLCFGQPMQETQRGENLNEMNQKMAQIAVKGEEMLEDKDCVKVQTLLDKNNDGNISETEFKEGLELLEVAEGEDLTTLNEFNQKMAQIAAKGVAGLNEDLDCVKVFAWLDEDKNGKFSEPEVIKGLEKLEA